MTAPGLNGTDGIDAILGASPESAAMRAFARRAAAVEAPVLLTGESGTGKGMLARAIHGGSRRGRAAFVAVNCAGVPESLFESEFFGHARGAFTGAHYAHRGVLEQADGGSLFLDEIGELPVPLQAKLLTVVEDGVVRRVGGERSVRVDVRIIAATAADLDAAVAGGRFRLDLFHRLLVLGYALPPLRTRGDDAVLLALHFLERHKARYGRAVGGFSGAAERRIREYDWPGNVRQLAHAVEAAVLACDGGVVRARHLPLRAWPGRPAAPASPVVRDGAASRPRYSFFGTEAEERACITAELRRARGNKTRAAAALGMTRNTLRARMKVLGITPSVAVDAAGW